MVGPSGVLASRGDTNKPFTLASVTKPLVARAVQIAIEEGAVDLDTPAGPPGSTIRHLLAHASGVAMRSAEVLARPGQRRIYSNYGFELLARAVEEAADIEFGAYLTEAVFEPLQMSASTLLGGAEAAGLRRRVHRRRPGGVRPGVVAPGAGVAATARRGGDGAVSRAGRGAARLRRATAQ